MRILHVVPTYVPAYRYGGPIYSVHGLCRALAARDHEIHVFTTSVDGPKDLPVPLGEPIDLDGVKVWYFASRVARRLYWSPTMGSALKSLSHKFDLFHLHSIFLWPTWMAARVARAIHIPYVVAPRGMLVPSLIAMKNRLAKLLWIKTIERRNLERAAAIHVTAKIEAREARRFKFDFPPMKILPNGVDISSPDEPCGNLSQAVEQAIQGQPMLLFLGRVNWKKGLDRLIPALTYIHGAHLVVAGNDEEGYGPFLEKLTLKYGVQKRVVFTGPVQGADKRALLRAAAALVLPSYSENFGNVVIEAMAEGCPVVVTPEVGVSEVVNESGSGLVVDGRAENLGPGIQRILQNPEQRREMGKRGRRVALEQFSWDSIACQTEALYVDILNSSGTTCHVG